jgi:hypothetical protein
MNIRAHPKLALILTEYTIYDARFLYWLETGIDVCYPPNVDYGCGEQVYLKIADAIIQHSRTIENRERQEEEAQKTHEMENQAKILKQKLLEHHCDGCLCKANDPHCALIPPLPRATDEENAADIAAIAHINNDW